ncbi:MAG: hypothetical protein GY940_13035 [bacterium]|nr:hypothetical protein [bacterium]
MNCILKCTCIAVILIVMSAGYGYTGEAVLYKNAYFRGDSIVVRAGEQLPDLVSKGFNDQVSSIRLKGNVKVTVYRHANFRGSSSEITHDVKDLREIGRSSLKNWNDTISAIIVEENPTAEEKKGGKNGN